MSALDLNRARREVYRLYTRALQCPEREVDFIASVATGPTLREDFCGTAEILHEWLRRSSDNSGLAIDIDPEPLRISKESIACGERAGRLVNADSVRFCSPAIDAVCAPNSSIFLLRTRDEILTYFKRSWCDLNRPGVVAIDIFGGPDTYGIGKVRLTKDKVTCIWDQYAFDPATSELEARIHLENEIGQIFKDAFYYRMRLWTPAEIVDALYEAGFSECEVLIGGSRYEISIRETQRNSEFAGLGEWEAYIVGVKR